MSRRFGNRQPQKEQPLWEGRPFFAVAGGLARFSDVQPLKAAGTPSLAHRVSGFRSFVSSSCDPCWVAHYREKGGLDKLKHQSPGPRRD